MTNERALADALGNKTRAVFLDVIANPQLQVAEIDVIATIAHRRGVPALPDCLIIKGTELAGRSMTLTQLAAFALSSLHLISVVYFTGAPEAQKKRSRRVASRQPVP